MCQQGADRDRGRSAAANQQFYLFSLFISALGMEDFQLFFTLL